MSNPQLKKILKAGLFYNLAANYIMSAILADKYIGLNEIMVM